MPVGNQQAIRANGLRDLEIVFRVANHQHVPLGVAALAHPLLPQFDFAVRVNIRQAENIIKIAIQLEMPDDVQQRVKRIRGENALPDAKLPDVRKRGVNAVK